MRFSYFDTIKQLPLTRQYVYYAVAYGLSTLIVPFGVQFLVNRLALSGIIVNMMVFFLFLAGGLIFTQLIRHSQVVLSEYLQRLIYAYEVKRWRKFSHPEKAHYFFEVHSLLKSFSKSFTHLVELGLIVIFGLMSILLFHPFFLIPAAAIIATIYYMVKTSGPAINTSILESNAKYRFFHEIEDGHDFSEESLVPYLSARDAHFSFVRRNSFITSLVVVGIQLLVLGIGVYLIQISQLSVGQLVSAEIIISGILMSLTKLPQTLEMVYEFETSQFKIAYALKGGEHEHA